MRSPPASDAAASEEKAATPATDPAATAKQDAAASDPPAADSSATSADLPDPKALLEQVRSTLQELDSLKCDLHETVLMSGMSFNAAGTYAEASGNRVHVEFRIFQASRRCKITY